MTESIADDHALQAGEDCLAQPKNSDEPIIDLAAAPYHCALRYTCSEIRTTHDSRFAAEFCLRRAVSLGEPCD